jgi:hypothetical protein
MGTNSVLKLRASDVIEKAKCEYEQKIAPITELMDSLFQKMENRIKFNYYLLNSIFR